MSANKIDLEDMVVGETYVAGYRHDGVDRTWESEFLGWSIVNSKPVALFRDADDDEWESYMFRGRFCVGSSASPLIIRSK